MIAIKVSNSSSVGKCSKQKMPKNRRKTKGAGMGFPEMTKKRSQLLLFFFFFFWHASSEGRKPVKQWVKMIVGFMVHRFSPVLWGLAIDPAVRSLLASIKRIQESELLSTCVRCFIFSLHHPKTHIHFSCLCKQLFQLAPLFGA